MLIGDYFYNAQYRGIFNGLVVDTSYGFLNQSGVSYTLGGSNTGCATWFFQGTFPTTTEINNFTNTSRSSDLLMKFDSVNATFGATPVINATAGATVGNIIAAGTMTWFAVGQLNQSSTNKPVIFGTVGLIGSGADLELPKVAIVSGDLWLLNFNLQFTESFTQV